MFKNPGGKIKGLAKVIFIVLCALYVIAGIVMIVAGIAREELLYIPVGLVTIGVGILIAWLSVLFLYAYGSMVEDVARIRAAVAPDAYTGGTYPGYGATSYPTQR